MNFATELLHDIAPDKLTGSTTLPIYQTAACSQATAEYLEKISANRKAGFVYSRIGNPTTAIFERRLADIERGAGAVAFSSGMAAVSAGRMLFLDSTVTTPYLVHPPELGADVVIHSTSKMINGGGNSIGGIVGVGKKIPRLAEFKQFGTMSYLVRLRVKILTDFGACPAPFNIFLTNVGLDTLTLRMEQACRNALELATFCAENKKVEINYFGLENNFYHDTSAPC